MKFGVWLQYSNHASAETNDLTETKEMQAVNQSKLRWQSSLSNCIMKNLGTKQLKPYQLGTHCRGGQDIYEAGWRGGRSIFEAEKI